MIRLLHGSAGSPEDWEGFIPLLGERPVRAIDLYSETPTSLDDSAALLNSAAGAGDALIGYSLGGRIALHALVAGDSPWSKAVIIGANPGQGSDAARLEQDKAWAALARDDWGRFSREWAAQPIFGGAAMPWDREAIGDSRREAIAQGFEVWSVGVQRALLHELEAVQIPVLWLAGERDSKYVDLCREAASRMPAGQFRAFPGSGHRVPWEAPEEVAAVIRSFLS